MNQQTGRFFTAVPLPEPIKQRLAEVIAEARQSLSFHKWAHPSDLHVTLLFLGETPISKLDAIRDTLTQTAAAFDPFSLRIEGLGTFGAPASPRVLWAGVKGDLALLQSLQRKISDAMSPLGFQPEDRPYRPHLTLARRYRGQHGSAGQALRQVPPPAGGSFAWTVNEIVLYESHMGKEPMYEAKVRFPLASDK